MKKLFFISLALSFILFGQQAKSSELKNENVAEMTVVSPSYGCDRVVDGLYADVYSRIVEINNKSFIIVKVLTSWPTKLVPSNNISDKPSEFVPVDMKYCDLCGVFEIHGPGHIAVEIREHSTDVFLKEILFVDIY